MAFYGNITNTSQTTFQFDRIYSNRLEMDVACANDSIFVGRYVLVEYDKETAFPVAYKEGNKFYSSKPGTSAVAEISFLDGKRPTPSFSYTTENGSQKDEIIQVQEIEIDSKTKVETVIGVTFYKCTGGNGDKKAIFEYIDKTTSTNSYINNFSLDEASYAPNSKNFGGYDSTVWIKTTVDSNGQLATKYVHIADLNSVVPTFDVAADAPTMSPLPPHFDADSTNVYYKLHVQAPYGLRVKAKINDIPSDANTYWTRETYDVKTGKTTKQYYNANNKDWINYTNESEIKKFAADIYYNKAAFDPQIGNTTINKHAKTSIENKIDILPTGESGQTYYDHNSKTYKKANDVQEISIHLPAIGDMMSDVWDVVHGENRDNARTDDHASLQGRLDSFKDMYKNQIPVKREPDGTFVGTNINGGKNRAVSIIEDEVLHIDDKTQDDAWIKTDINTTELTNKNEKNNGISIHHTFTPGSDTTTSANKNDGAIGDGINKGKNDKLKLYTPIVDAAGHVVAENTETVILPYGYKTIKTDIGLTDEAAKDIYTMFDSETATEPENEEKVTSTSSSTTANNTQDILSVTPFNKWIQVQLKNDELQLAHEIHGIDTKIQTTNKNIDGKDSELDSDKITVQDLGFDRAGHVIKNRLHTHTLPFGFKTITTNGRGSNTDINATTTPTTSNIVADNTQDTFALNSCNKWIRIDTNANTDSLAISHDIHDTTATSSTDTLSSTSKVTSFEVYNDSFDKAGHYTSRNTKTITMPTGYNTVTGDSGSTTASATADTLAITANDVWLQTEVTADKVNITHTGPASGTKRNKSDKTPQFGDTFIIEDWSFDSKGHKNEVSTHTIMIPKGSLNDLTATTSSVITGLSMVDETGAITQTNNDVGKLALTGYDSTTAGQTVVGSGDSINVAIGKLQNQITNEKKRINTILTGEDDLDDTINTFKELQEYIATHGEDAADMAASINNEISRAQGAETALGARIDNLDYEKAETTNYYISSIKQVDGKIEASTKQIPIRTVATGSSNGTISVNGINVNVKGLGSAAYTASTAYATAEQGGRADSAVQKTTTFTYGAEAKTIEQLMAIVNEQATTITTLSGRIDALEERIKALENPTTGE